MKKYLTIFGIFILTILIVLVVDHTLLSIFLSLKGLEYDASYSLTSSIYTVAGLIGVCTYIICKRK